MDLFSISRKIVGVGLRSAGSRRGYQIASCTSFAKPCTCPRHPLILVGMGCQLLHCECRLADSAGKTRINELSHYDTLIIKLRL